MTFLLFLQSLFVEIKKIPANYLVGVMSRELSILVIFPEPGLANINMSVFAFDRHLQVHSLKLSGNKFLHTRLVSGSV